MNLHGIAILVCIFASPSVDGQGRDLEYAAAAAASFHSCHCQCSSYSYVDEDGEARGNCWSTYLGRHWCYTDQYDNLCQDLEQGEKSGRLWSYQACTTPNRESAECRRHFDLGDAEVL